MQRQQFRVWLRRLVIVCGIASMAVCLFSIFLPQQPALLQTTTTAPYREDRDAVEDNKPLRFGLFSLFRPQQLTIQLIAHKSAMLSAGNHRDTRLTSEDTMQIHKLGRQMTITITDLYGRVKQTIIAPGAHLTTEEAATFTITIPGKIRRQLRGDLLITAQPPKDSSALQIVLTVTSKAAIASIIAAEINTVQYPEALKAVAVVVRTFLQAHPSRHAAEGFGFCDTTHCQFYRGEDDLTDEVRARAIQDAVAATKGEVLRFRGHLLEGFYTAACGGITATPESVWGGTPESRYPYQRIACHWCSNSPYQQWERSIAAASIRQALSTIRRAPLSTMLEISVQNHPMSEVAQTVVITDGAQQIRLSGDQFRRLIGQKIGWNRILSPTFTVERRGNFFIFRGRGFGSQVGLCVAGTIAQARSRRTYRDILSFYYPQTESLRGQE